MAAKFAKKIDFQKNQIFLVFIFEMGEHHSPEHTKNFSRSQRGQRSKRSKQEVEFFFQDFHIDSYRFWVAESENDLQRELKHKRSYK